jgi:hypothetical protein
MNHFLIWCECIYTLRNCAAWCVKYHTEYAYEHCKLYHGYNSTLSVFGVVRDVLVRLRRLSIAGITCVEGYCLLGRRS